jgi:hypothetical protein
MEGRMPAAGSAPTLAEIEAIVALDSDVVLRNLRITQGYHDLARALSGGLGEENLNWCAFAVWASKAAGRFIRKGDVAAELGRRLADAPALVRMAIDRIDAKLTRHRMRHGSILAYLDAVLAETAAQITLGNLIVFAELGPLFVALIETLDAAGGDDPAAVDRFLARLRPGPVEADGQDLLRSAFTRFFRARAEADAKRKAEHLLAANFATGLHEQIRLQPPIAAALDAPVDQGVRELSRELAAKLPGGMANALYKLFLRVATPFVARTAKRLFREVATRRLIEYRLPDGALDVGRDLPVRPGRPPFPAVLATLDDAALRALLARYGAADDSLLGSRATDWADLDERMGYIAELFRSRQQDRGLFAPPFTAAQRAEIAAGRLPEGDL